MNIPLDYAERVYAGVLGKIIGVYLGRPFEGWLYDEILAKLGNISGYVHERLKVPLVVVDDDISGTFTFLRALPDYGNRPDLTAQQIGQTWLNYLIERKTTLWWGGMGNSTEHTAYMRLKSGIQAPLSGASSTNGKSVSEQIGAQIFIDGWAMVSPGDPERAADLAKRAASVSHGGEAIYGAQVVAAIEAHAFVERDLNVLLDTAVRLIPNYSVIYRLIKNIREWHAANNDWRKTRTQIAAHYGYDKYGGNCHIVPNHALIIMALLHGEGDFSRSLTIVNTSGWDTDCNSGNVGCMLGIRNGLAGLEGSVDWRGPVADRIYLSSADSGNSITDAVQQTDNIVNIGRALAGLDAVYPKQGARFHFDLPGAMQGFRAGSATLKLENVRGHSALGAHTLALHFTDLGPAQPAEAMTATFIPADAAHMRTYDFVASPTIYPGQTLRASVSAAESNAEPIRAVLALKIYGADDQLVLCKGTSVEMAPGAAHTWAWELPTFGGHPIAEVGLILESDRLTSGSLYLDYLTWDGTPNVIFEKPADNSTLWTRAWANGLDQLDNWPEAFRLIQNAGRGLMMQGTRDWRDYAVSATLTPHLAKATGLAVRVQGMRRYYALMLRPDDKIELVKLLDGEHILASAPMPWALEQSYHLEVQVQDATLRAFLDGKLLFALEDADHPLDSGAIGLLCEEGRVACHRVEVRPLPAS